MRLRVTFAVERLRLLAALGVDPASQLALPFAVFCAGNLCGSTVFVFERFCPAVLNAGAYVALHSSPFSLSSVRKWVTSTRLTAAWALRTATPAATSVSTAPVTACQAVLSFPCRAKPSSTAAAKRSDDSQASSCPAAFSGPARVR